MRKLSTTLACLIFTLVGCAAAVPRALDNIRPGQDKDSVLQSAGNPERTFRENNQDHWVYLYFQSGQQWLRDVIFDDGKVLQVTRANAAKETWVKDLEGTKSLEEFERKARDHQRSKAAK